MMNEKMIRGIISMVKPLLPNNLKEELTDKLKAVFLMILDRYRSRLAEDEEDICIVIQADKGVPYFIICSIDETNRIRRTFADYTMEQLIQIVEEILKKEKMI